MRLPLGVVPASGQRTDSGVIDETNDTEPQRAGIGWGHSFNKKGEIAVDQIGGDSPNYHLIAFGPQADEAD